MDEKIIIEAGGDGYFLLNGIPKVRGAYDIEPLDGDNLEVYCVGDRDHIIVKKRPITDFYRPGGTIPFTSITEFVTYLTTDNFFFRDTSGGNPPPSDLATYRALNRTTLDSIATAPQEGETAYLEQSEGNELLSWIVNFNPSGLWLYTGGVWESDKKKIAEQLQISVDDIDAIEILNASQDTLIAANAGSIVSETTARQVADTALSGRLTILESVYEVFASIAFSLTAAYSIIPMDQEVETNSDFTLLGSGRVQCNFSGKSKVTFSGAGDSTDGDRSNGQWGLHLNGAVIGRAIAWTYHRSVANGEDGYCKSVTLDLTSGDIIDVRGLVIGDNVDTLPQVCNILFERK